MKQFTKENILQQIENMENMENIKDAYCITNLYNQKLYIVHLKPINNIEISITNCELKYKIEIKKADSYKIFSSGEILYSSIFSPIISFKIRKIVKQYENIKRNERLKEILK